MKIQNNRIVCFDIDDTTILWSDYSYDDPSLISIKGFCEESVLVKPNQNVINRIKQHKNQGHFVVLWSAAGVDWVERVVNTLKLDKYVDLMITKPQFSYDDLPPHAWINWIDVTKF